MTYKEIFLNFKGLITKQMIALDALMQDGIPADSNLNELVLSVALCDYTTEVRNAAKKVLKKHGNPATKEALTLLSRRNYQNDSGKKNLQTDMPELEKIAGFRMTQFAKYLFIRNSYLDSASNYFFEHATDEEFRFYFINDCYRSTEGDNIRIYPGRKVSGRIAQIMWDSVPEVADLVTLISCKTDGNISINLEGVQMPNLYELSLHTQMDALPAEIFDLTSIHKLGVTVNTNKLPEGFGKLTNLNRLYISAPVSELPADLFTLENLEWLTIEETKLQALPEAIGNLKGLTTIGISDNPELKVIPQSLFDLPKLHDVYKRDIKAQFMPANEYEVLFNDMEYVLRWFRKIPSVQEQMDKFKAGEPNFMPELILSASRCYYDDEHGLELTDLYSPIEKTAPAALQAVNKAIKKPKFIDERTSVEELEKIKQKVQTFEGFHSDVFMQFIYEMVEYVNTKYPFEKW